MSSGSITSLVLVEKHFIPVAMYREIYGNSQETFTSTSYRQTTTISETEIPAPPTHVADSFPQHQGTSYTRVDQQLPQMGATYRFSESTLPTRSETTTTTTPRPPSLLNMFDLIFPATPTTRRLTVRELNQNSSIEINDSQTNGGMTCAVCQDDITDGNVIRRLSNCGHVFHIRCVDRWCYDNMTCPICRSIIAATTMPSAS